VKSSVRELEGSIIKLLAYASLKHRDITVELAREALRDKLRAEDAGARRRGARRHARVRAGPGGVPAGAPLTPFVIQQAVSAEWGVTPDGLQSKTRTKTLTVPRQVAMWLCRELLGAAARRDRQRVRRARPLDRDPLARARVAMMAEDDAFRERVEKVRAMLESLRGDPPFSTAPASTRGPGLPRPARAARCGRRAGEFPRSSTARPHRLPTGEVPAPRNFRRSRHRPHPLLLLLSLIYKTDN
jgi:hypothetical protein